MSKKRKFKRTRKRKMKLTQILIGLILITTAFFFVLRSIASPIIEQKNSQREQGLSQQAFIDELVPHAQVLQDGYGILPSIIIGQAILESNWGESLLASKYNNLFGIKAYGRDRKVNLETKEFVNEEWITIQGDFRVYDSWEESMDDHTMLFVYGVDWNPALYEGVLSATSFQEAAQALQDAGYATDPDYAKKIIHVIEAHQLYKFDRR